MSVKKYIKAENLRDKSLAELKALENELKADLFTHRFHKATGKLDNFQILAVAKRRLAAVKTLVRQHELAAQSSKEAN